MTIIHKKGCVCVCVRVCVCVYANKWWGGVHRGCTKGGGGRRGKNHLVKEKIRLGGWKGVGRVLR